MSSVMTVFIATLKAFYRDKMLMFFTLLFPLIFGVIFGVVFAGSSDGAATLVGVLKSDALIHEALKDNKNVEISEYQNITGIKKAIGARKLSIAMVIEGKNLNVYVNKMAALSNQYLTILPNEVGEKLATRKMPKDFGIIAQNIAVKSGQMAVTQNAYFMPGIIALSLFTSGMFAAIELFSRYRENRLLKRLRATGLRSWKFVLASILGRLVVSVAAAVLLFAILQAMFRVDFTFNIPLLISSIVFGSLLMLSFGTAVAVASPSASVATNIAIVFMTTMFFFAGVYFPIEFLPGSLQLFGKILPLYHLARGLRMAFGVEKILWDYIYWQYAIIMISFVFFTIYASRKVFKQE